GFNSNSGAVRGHLCGKDVSNDNPTKRDSPAIGVTGLIFSHDSDGNHGDDDSGDVEEVVIEKVALDVDISQSKPVVTMSEKIPDPTFEKVVMGVKKHSNLNVLKHSDDMGYSKTEAHVNKLKSLAPSGPSLRPRWVLGLDLSDGTWQLLSSWSNNSMKIGQNRYLTSTHILRRPSSVYKLCI
nr:hypothetical protein [Tanacetum cinerariifolium]